MFDYIVKTKKPFHDMSREEALKEALYLLDIAADLDAATGGWSKVLPLAKTISPEGIEDVSEDELRAVIQRDQRRGRRAHCAPTVVGDFLCGSVNKNALAWH